MSTALYRRYRPDRFEDVIGQDHVTVPLRTALAKDRVNHAYLFSGPRGCGKTTSARILARCLNCAQGPTSTPCGECESCRDLATGGPGSLDVMEIDAASHGGVEDARGLRERATFAPVRDRFKILIIDEAHMVTAAGFNALLKIVEEPPEHLKFIFATTEPDKVIGTIRSRTHHYPFRLVPPEPLITYLEQLCTEEGVRVEPGVLPLVVRAGTGSVRDTLSVLDQLIGGAEQGQVSYALAVSLLGFTPETLLDDVIDALAADDTPTVFRVVDRVVQSGQDPRRFVEDLLDRFRDLVIARALPEEAGSILHGMPDDQVRRLAAQSAQLSRAELSRLADVTNLALTDMVGATSPRLHLELLMARLMLPATDDTHRGLAARFEALERRLDHGPDHGGVRTAAGFAPRDDTAHPTSAASSSGAPDTEAATHGGAGAPAAGSSTGSGSGPEVLSGAALARAAMRRGDEETPAPRAAPVPAEPSPAPAPEKPAAAQQPATEVEHPAATSSPTSSVEMVRRAWPEILAALEDSSRLVWMLVKDNTTVAGYDGSLLTVGFTQDGPRQSLLGRRGDQVLAEAVHRVLGIRPELDLILGGDAPRTDARTPSDGRPTAVTSERTGAATAAPSSHGPAEAPAPHPASPPAPQPAPNRPSERRSAPGSAPQPTAESRRPALGTPAPDRPASPERASGRAGGAITTPTPAPPADSWGHPGEAPPPWDVAPPPEDPWGDLPEFDPESNLEDSPGPEGWTPPPGAAGEPVLVGAPREDAAADPAPDPDVVRRMYDPGPLVREEDLAIPAFARPEAELRAEFEARFGSTRPLGFDAGDTAGAPDPIPSSTADRSDQSTPADAAATPATRAALHGEPLRAGQDAAENVGEAAATEREDPHPAAASAPDHPPPSSAEPTADDAPDPGVPAEHHEETPGAGGRNADGTRGSGHPDSMFPRLMDCLEAGGPLDPPVNAAPSAASGDSAGPAGPGRPSASALGAVGDTTPPPPPEDGASLSARAAAIRAAREAAQGRGPAPVAVGNRGRNAAPASVDWSAEVASDDDVALEESGLVGRPVVERLLGARLLEERSHTGAL